MGEAIWITRAEPGASATAEKLITIGHQPIIAPLLKVEPLAAKIELGDAAALAFTSRHGVSAFAALCPERALPVYTVGEATAEAARLAGFGTVFSADGDAAALCALIARDKPGEVLAPGAAERAADLTADLAKSGVICREIAVYETLVLEPPAGFDAEAADVVLVHSPKAGRALAAHLAAHPAPHLRALCISLAAAAPEAATPLEDLEAAAHPNEAALLALI